MDHIHISLDIVAVEWVFSGTCEMSLATLSCQERNVHVILHIDSLLPVWLSLLLYHIYSGMDIYALSI